MRRAIGPIVTTGVAMAAAGVVVANPILVPRSDVQIPAVALSAGTADSMLDKSFLDAIAPAPTESTSPLSVLKQLVSALAADAKYIGKNAIVDAFVAGVGAVNPDVGTNNTFVVPPAAPVPAPAPAPVAPPIFAPAPDVPSVVAQVPHVDVSVLSATIANVPVDINNAASTFVNGSVVPAVEGAISSIAFDATYISSNVIKAAFAFGAAVAAEPGLIGATLTALVKGDIGGALQNAVKAVVKVVETPFTSSMLIITAITDIIENHIDELLGILHPVVSVDPPASPPSTTDGTDVTATPAPITRRPGVDVLVSNRLRTRDANAASSVAASSVAASSVGALSPRSAAALPAFDAGVRTPRQAAVAVRDAVRSVGEQVAAAVEKPVGKAGARARAAAAR